MNTMVITTAAEHSFSFGELAGIALIIFAFIIGFAIVLGIADNGWPDFKRKK